MSTAQLLDSPATSHVSFTHSLLAFFLFRLRQRLQNRTVRPWPDTCHTPAPQQKYLKNGRNAASSTTPFTWSTHFASCTHRRVNSTISASTCSSLITCRDQRKGPTVWRPPPKLIDPGTTTSVAHVIMDLTGLELPKENV